MGAKDPRVDAYIAQSAEFAKPILKQIRRMVRAGCPKVEETLKWGFPHFMYKGILCGMAAFKNHCAFGFWKGSLGQYGRITAVSDLPDEEAFLRLVKKAAALNDQGIKVPARRKPRAGRELEIPDRFMAALRRNKKALATFNAFSYTNKKEYVEWVTAAKADETRNRRLKTAVAWMAEGKPRNWKYIKAN